MSDGAGDGSSRKAPAVRRPLAFGPLRKLSRDWMAVAAGLSLLLVAITLSGGADRVDDLFYDWSTRAASHAPPDDIVVVAIDDESLSALGPWPWPRAIHAAMLRRLATYHPLAVVYDILYLGRSARPEDDAALGRAFAAIPHAFVPMQFKVPGDDGRGYDPIPPIGPVQAGATVGHAMVHPDRDGVVRRLNIAIDGERRWTHIAALAAALRPSGQRLTAELPRFAARPPNARLRRQGEVLIGFGGPPGHVRTASFISVLRGETPASLLTGHYVLIGATAPGLGDQFSTPAGGDAGVMSGIEIQANFLDTLLSGAPIGQASALLRLALGLPALWLLMIGFLRLPPNSAGLLGVGLMIAVVALSAALLFLGHLWLPPVATLIVLTIAQPLWTWRRLSGVSNYMIEELSRLTADPDLATTTTPRRAPLAQDHIATQVELMRETVDRVRGLRRLIGAAVRSLPDPTVLVALDGAITLANAEAQALFGDRGRLEAADIERFFAASGPPPFGPSSFTDSKRPWIGERAGADGSLREILHVPWTDESGAPLGWVVRFADITAMRRAENAREEALQLLTHDMRSPQASILALVAEESASPETLRSRVAHYAKRTLALADGFLRLARADAGNYEREPTDIADVMTEATDDLWVLASSRGVRIVFDGADHEILSLGNRALLIRAFTNILDNAVKFSPSGSTIDCAIRGGGACGRGDIVCTVTDHGAGMSPEIVGKLFQRFSHHASGLAGPVDGVGLGLAFVQSVVKGHGGAITCRSAPGVGTTFEIVLPALSDSAHGAQTDQHQ